MLGGLCAGAMGGRRHDCRGNLRNLDELVACGALNLFAGVLFLTGQMLFAMRTLELDITHSDSYFRFSEGQPYL